MARCRQSITLAYLDIVHTKQSCMSDTQDLGCFSKYEPAVQYTVHYSLACALSMAACILQCCGLTSRLLRVLLQAEDAHQHLFRSLQANVEESEMNRLHGKQYSEYSSRVSKLIPGIF